MRIGINVPNELLKQVKEISPPVNVSEECRKALQHCVEIQQMATAQVGNDALQGKISELVEKTSLPPEPDWVGLALDNAAHFVEHVTPEDWNDFVELADELSEGGHTFGPYIGIWTTYYDGRGMMNVLYEYGDQIMKTGRPSRVSGLAQVARERGEREYTRAWIGYVNEVRRLIRQRHKEAYDSLRARYAADHQARPTPEAPEHLL